MSNSHQTRAALKKTMPSKTEDLISSITASVSETLKRSLDDKFEDLKKLIEDPPNGVTPQVVSLETTSQTLSSDVTAIKKPFWVLFLP